MTSHGGDDKSVANSSSSKRSARSKSLNSGAQEEIEKRELVLKVTSVSSRYQREIAEKEAKLLSRLSHPSIVKMFDTCYRTVSSTTSGFRKSSSDDKNKDRTQHFILMEYCEGGHAMNICTQLVQKGEHFDLSTLIIAFGQICNAVSYLHAQRPPIVHRDLKPENFLIKGGAYKLCDFGSAVFGHVDLKTTKARQEAEEVIEKTTTQMFRAPEMVDLYMAKKLTQATDVWALGCCLYSLSFLKNCFEEGSNLAILSRNYKIPDDNPFGDGLPELIDRMLTEDSKSRADMTEVILCLSAVYSGKPLPPRKERKSKEKDKKEKEGGDSKEKKDKEKHKKGGTFRTDGQGVQGDLTLDPTKVKEAKKLDPNSAAARRRQAAGGDNSEFATFHSRFDEVKSKGTSGAVNQDLAFSTTDNPFASFEGKDGDGGGDAVFGSFEDNHNSDEIANVFDSSADWDTTADFNSLSIQSNGRGRAGGGTIERKPRARSVDNRRARKKDREVRKDETPEEAIDRLADEDDDDMVSVADTVHTKGGTPIKTVVRRGVRRMQSSSQPRQVRSSSRGTGLRRTKSGTQGSSRTGTPSRKRSDSTSKARNKDESDDNSDDNSSDINSDSS